MESRSLNRYHRQMILPEIGEAGQRRLASAGALLVGCGALGCAQADLLARAGVGRLIIVDRDVVEVTNLQRQALFDERDAREAMPKADAAVRRLRAINSSITIRPVVADFEPGNAQLILDESGDIGVILDGTDNLGTRYLLNDLAVRNSIPYIYGGAVGMRGMTMTVRPGAETPCLRCVFPDLPTDPVQLTCDTAGILGPVVSIIGAWQAVEAIKVLTGQEAACAPGLLEMDVWGNRVRRLSTGARAAGCPCCGERGFEFLEGRHVQPVSVICTRNAGGAVQLSGAQGAVLDLGTMRARLAPHGELLVTEHSVRCVLRHEQSDSGFPIEITVFRDGRTIVRGTTELGIARSIHARYVGA